MTQILRHIYSFNLLKPPILYTEPYIVPPLKLHIGGRPLFLVSDTITDYSSVYYTTSIDKKLKNQEETPV